MNVVGTMLFAVIATTSMYQPAILPEQLTANYVRETSKEFNKLEKFRKRESFVKAWQESQAKVEAYEDEEINALDETLSDEEDEKDSDAA